MANSDLVITIAGPALSLLLYDNVRSHGNQIGFLLGETLEFVTKTCTDLENQIETKKIYNNIEAVINCPLSASIHDSIGRLNKETLKEFLHDQSKHVIGWFHFREEMSLVPTFRDKILHKEFASYFSNGNGSKEQFFVTCLLSSSMSNRKGLHKFKHVFLRNRKGIFEPVPLTISNLGSSPFMHEGSDYKFTPTKKSSDAPDAFMKLVESLNLSSMRLSSGVDSAVVIQKEAERHLKTLLSQICSSEKEVANLEQEIQDLRKKIEANVDKCYEAKNDDLNEEIQKEMAETTFLSTTEHFNHSYDEYSKIEDSSTRMSESLANLVREAERGSKITVPRLSKIGSTAACIERNVNQSKMKAETKCVNENMLRSRQFSNMESEIVRESICKGGESNLHGVGRGGGKLRQDAQSGMKKARTTSGPGAARSSNERMLNPQVQQQDSAEANNIQSPSPSYNQITKQKGDNIRKLSTPDNH